MGCYVWYSDEGTGRGPSPPRPLVAVPNVTAHPSTASVPITVLLYNGPLLCGFNVPIKGFKVSKDPIVAVFYRHILPRAPLMLPKHRRLAVNKFAPINSLFGRRHSFFPLKIPRLHYTTAVFVTLSVQNNLFKGIRG